MTRTGNNPDTALGGESRRFPSTCWSRFVGGFGAEGRANVEAAAQLAREYWKPIYAYIRIQWSKSNEDAKDLTQAFFLWLAGDEALKEYRPDKGGFRAFLKVLLSRFVGHRDLALRRLKRGGNARTIPMDGDASLQELVPDPSAADPAAAFDREWVVDVVNAAVDRVRERFLSSGRGQAFAVYEACDLAPEGERPTYVDLCSRFGLKDAELRARLAAVREEVRAEVRSELRDMTADDIELEEEWRSLFGA